jgi:glycosyltransferase involved in cell wall biosynthesis
MTEKIIYVSDLAYTKSMKWKYSPNKQSVVIPNGTESSPRNTSERTIRNILGISQERVVLCFVGRLEPQKGVDILIKALRFIPKAILDTLEVWIVGTGSAKQELEWLSQSFKLQKYIRFLGYQENTGRYLRESDIFALPSYYEAMSIALLEAMAYALPCIVTNTGENPRLITHGVDGFVIPIGDAKMLASFLVVLVNDSEIRKDMGLSAQKKGRVFSESEMVNKIKDIYQIAIQNLYQNRGQR